MRLAVARYAVTGPIPAIDGTVVQAQRIQLWNLAALHHADRIVLEFGRQDDPETRDVLLEDFDDGLLNPVIAEMHTRLKAAGSQCLGTGIDGILEHRNAALVPQALSEQDG